MEYARHVLGIKEAQHEEEKPDATTLVVNQLTCSLVGQTATMRIPADTHASHIYGKSEIAVPYFCNYGLNPAFRSAMVAGGLTISGLDVQGDVRMIELSKHRFFIGTLFLPQFASAPGKPEPLITAFLKSAMHFRSGR